MPNRKFPAKKSGFSVIKISITLVIFALLLVGIVSGKAFLKNSEQRTIIGEARSYNIAAINFYNQYNYLPGDYKNPLGDSGGNPANQGDGNGVIEFVNGNGDTTTKAAEGLIAWQHLKNSGMMNDPIFATPASVEISSGSYLAQTPGITIPASKIAGAGWIFDGINKDSFVVITGPIVSKNVAPTGVATFANLTGAIDSNTALAIDKKIDDAKSNFGKVRVIASQTLSGISCDYSASIAAPKCSIGFQIRADIFVR